MDTQIQLISDGDGLAIIGDPLAVERFLDSEGLASRDLGLQRLGSVLNAGSGVAQAGSEIAASSGRWVKLTKESAQAIDKFGLRESSKSGLSTGVLKGNKGQVKGFVEFAKMGPGSMLTNPALLSGAAGIMAQAAMKQAMDEILDYLATIDEKVDDVLRAQKDSVLARMIGVGLVIEEAMTLRESRGRVDDITWSKVQNAPATIAETQAYAVRQLDALAEKVESKAKIGDLAKASKDAQSKTQEWLAVLARCFHLQDAIAVLELDRVLDASPDELDGHRLGLKAARAKRLDLILSTTEHLLARMDAAAGVANTKVLLNPINSREVVQASNQVGAAVVEFQGRLGIERSRDALESRRWSVAANEAKDKALETSGDGVDAAKRFGSETLGRAKWAGGKISRGIGDRVPRRRGDDDKPDDEG